MKTKQSKAEKPDRENPEWTAGDFRRAKRVADVFPEIVKAAKRARGRPKLANPKVQVTLRVDANVLAKFKATGAGWQTRVNAALVKAAPKRAKTSKVA